MMLRRARCRDDDEFMEYGTARRTLVGVMMRMGR